MANSATLRNTVPLQSMGKLYEYKINYDTGSSGLTIRSASTGVYQILAGLTMGTSANASWQIQTNSTSIAGSAMAANTVNTLPFRPGQAVAVSDFEKDITFLASAALVNNLGIAYVVEADATQLANYMGRA